jgi:hypothetical protein
MADVYRPPKTVVDECELSGNPMSLEEVGRLYSLVDKGEALRWTRRILRKTGVIGVCPTGEVELPESVDLQLGPDIIASVTKADVGIVTDHITRAGVCASCVPIPGGTVAFFPSNLDDFSKDFGGILELGEADWDEAVMIDESLAKARSYTKAGDGNVVGFDCWPFDYKPIPGIKWDETFYLKTRDITEQESQIIKVDDELGIVLGWAIISTIRGEPYFDKQGDYVPDESMLEATVDFMIHSRTGGEMHGRTVDEKGEVIPIAKGVILFCWPMTAEIAKAFGISTDRTGLMIALKPDDEEILEKFRSGEYTGFSIGGHRILTEEVD